MNYFRTHTGTDTTDYLYREVNYVYALLTNKYFNKIDKIADYDEEGVIQILNNLERVLYAIRSAWNKKELTDVQLEELQKTNPVDISVEGNLLRVSTPATTIRKQNTSYYLASLVCDAMQQYEREHPEINWMNFFDGAYIAVQVRKYLRNKCTSKILKDNNNEDGNIINAVTRNMMARSDSVANMVSFTNTVQPVDSINEVGMEFVFFPANELEKHVNEVQRFL